MAISKHTSGELKTRVNSCLNKLSDRDTLSIAASELESIARTLPNDSFAPFLNCLSATDSSEKSPVRRHSVRLLGVLSAAHGDALSPHVSRMISTVIRRLRDPDSAVRAACVDAVSSIVTHVNSPPFVAILKPLVDSLFHEQDSNVQIGASLCLSAAVEAAPSPDAPELRKLLPRVLKLVRSDCFKAKPNLLLFVGSIVSTGCVKNKNSLNSVISTAIEFLSSEDWAARKAAAEVLDNTAASEPNFAAELKASSLGALESRRFDKVKIVRETMNRALETWRSLPALPGHVSSSQETSTDRQSPGSPGSIVLETPRPGKTLQQARSPLSNSPTNSEKTITKLNQDSRQRSLSSRTSLNRNSRSKVVPFNCNDSSSESQDYEDLSVIRKHLQQIENQQSNLLDLIQRFIGSSQKGMSSLERRVDGLEKVLDEMSQDFAISRRGVPAGPDFGGNRNTCCMIPGAEFLSPKFWRRAEGQQTCSNNSRMNTSSYTNMSGQGILQRDAMAEAAKIGGSPRNY